MIIFFFSAASFTLPCLNAHQLSDEVAALMVGVSRVGGKKEGGRSWSSAERQQRTLNGSRVYSGARQWVGGWGGGI